MEKNGAPIELIPKVGSSSNDPLGMGVVRRSYQLHRRITNALQMQPTPHGLRGTDRYLASVGLGFQAIAWRGFTLGERLTMESVPTTSTPTECLRKLDQHQGFVKGVRWDPVGEFFATQSGDASVKIWSATDRTLGRGMDQRRMQHLQTERLAH